MSVSITDEEGLYDLLIAALELHVSYAHSNLLDDVSSWIVKILDYLIASSACVVYEVLEGGPFTKHRVAPALYRETESVRDDDGDLAALAAGPMSFAESRARRSSCL
jgi:hypothetical protein